MNRRTFLQSVAMGSATLAPAAAVPAAEAERLPDDRAAWVAHLVRVAEPVLAHLAANQLKAKMPVEAKPGQVESRRAVTHLEAIGRTLCGIAPWLATTGGADAEVTERKRLLDATLNGLTNIVMPGSPDSIHFTAAAQNLVDASFLACAFARGRNALWEPLSGETKARFIAAFQSTRKFKPGQNNWLLFSAMIEAFLASVGAEWKAEPIETGFAAHENWYKGDGAYGDGPQFHWDYYNSYVIQPYLVTILDLIAALDQRWEKLRPAIQKRAVRFAAVQEMLVAPDGTFPPIGRSIAYRCGAFHHLATMALRRELPRGLPPAQVRGALSAVIHRTLTPKGTFDANGWLRIGLSGHQPSLAEGYISTGSLYLATFAFLPLGLPANAPFWTDPATPWTQRKAWSGQDLPADHAI